jgi:hypothetical protein
MCLSCVYHVSIMCVSCVYHVSINVYHVCIMCVSCVYHVSINVYHVSIMCLSCVYHVCIMCLSCVYHVLRKKATYKSLSPLHLSRKVISNSQEKKSGKWITSHTKIANYSCLLRNLNESTNSEKVCCHLSAGISLSMCKHFFNSVIVVDMAPTNTILNAVWILKGETIILASEGR